MIGGKYELISPLGEGGMGSVWLARNVQLDSRVALKLLRAEFDAEDAGERLLQEARAAARLGHRAIVRVFDFGQTAQEDPFIVMELLEGETLSTLLANRGRVAPTKAVQIILPVLDALAVAHTRGIVHRDLKPDNIFLSRETRRTQPKIVDFGIAKVDQGVAARTLTRQGTVLGSPGYMSPEQARGSDSIDFRADIWAVCVVVYECVTGQPAFEGDNYNALMRAIIEDTVVPITQVAAGDAALWAILERGLKKEPGERWASAHDLGRALAEWLVAHGVETDISGEPVRTWLEADSSRSRDLLSAPPPSLAYESNRSGPSKTQGDSVPAATSFRPSPESTSAVVRSHRPQRFPGGIPFIAAIAALIMGSIGLIALVTRSHPNAPASNSSPVVVAAPAPPPAPAKPVVTGETGEPRVEPVREDPAATKPQAATNAARPPANSAPHPPRKPLAKQPPGAKSEGTGSDLKDPY
jgi:serine/threonine-protein kinase